MGKIESEKQSVYRMIRLYCRKKHMPSDDLCPECETLKQYAFLKLDNCRFKDDKKACRYCPAHCYQKDMRVEIRKVMQLSGPRMILYDPVVVFKHLFN